MRLLGADEGAEGDEAEMPVELQLARGGGNDADVVAVVEAVAHGVLEELWEDDGFARIGLDGEQAHFAGGTAGGQVCVEIGELAVDGKGARAANGEHSHEAAILQANDVGVFSVKTIHEALVGVRGVLGDFLDEGAVIEAVDLLNFPIFGRDFVNIFSLVVFVGHGGKKVWQ
nr:hypothetical protein [Ereboglobus luteus]